jgi:hypothetical protein
MPEMLESRQPAEPIPAPRNSNAYACAELCARAAKATILMNGNEAPANAGAA